MNDAAKKSKVSTESLITDVAATVESVGKSLAEINKSHGNLLRVNKAVVELKLDIEKEKRRDLNTTVPIPEGN